MSYICFKIVNALVFLQIVVFVQSKTIYQAIEDEEKFSKFYELIRSNGVAKVLLKYEDVTAFIPTNDAFSSYESDLYSSMAFYHVTYGLKGIADLKYARNLTASGPKAPPLWINRLGENIFINNAKIVMRNSDKLYGSTRNQQILHVIDRVLDPMLRDLTYPFITALDVMVNPSKWRIETSPKFDTFLYKTKETQMRDAFSVEGGHTFFLPIDSGIDTHNFKVVNKYVIGAHIVPNFVLFTRSTMQQLTHESMANDDLVFTVISLEENNGKFFVRANTVIGDSVNQKGQYVAEILVANIPVKNGVVHLISNPLGISARRLKPFPYLPILHKITADPTLSTFYEMGEETGFNKIFTTHNVSFTYFIPKDTVFWKLKQRNITLIGSNLDILKKHLVVSKEPLTMEKLLYLSANNKKGIELEFLAGRTKIEVLNFGEEYVIRWRNKYIRVARPDYECTNGVVHILEGVLANVQQPRELEVEENMDHFKNYKDAVVKMFDDII